MNLEQNNEEDLTWSEYILERAKKLFKTDDLNDDRVLELVLQNVIRDGKLVHIEIDDLVPFEQWQVLVNDDENTSWHLCVHVADTKENAEKWVVDNNLKFSE